MLFNNRVLLGLLPIARRNDICFDRRKKRKNLRRNLWLVKTYIFVVVVVDFNARSYCNKFRCYYHRRYQYMYYIFRYGRYISIILIYILDMNVKVCVCLCVCVVCSHHLVIIDRVRDKKKKTKTKLAFTIIVGATDHLAVGHVGALLTATLAICFAHFVATFHSIAAHLLAILFIMQFLRLLQCNNLFHLLSGQMINMILNA